ncbi:putative ubiquitin conjugating protein [Rosellinia necatrix]|uniref:Putative ubiquitin conjugating protein n=1 Tax=Rosellinia necatrix TaxID=77044 RepID=A0A1S8A778_ROSNE|nr:putative ubiquitin conjugating protein [Rosellinia necatrix]
MAEFKQDPRYTAVGPSRTNLFIPKTAFASARQQQGQTFASSAMDIVNGDGSDEEDIEDIMFLTEGDSIENHIIGVTHPSTPRKSLTDFHPGGLNFSELPQLALPSYATKPGQQAIQRELLKLQEIQSTIPLHELGWYLDFERIENMFQWIVQLHSFDLCLPLAQDMQKAGIDSIVLEIRFLRRFPLTPPFVRVIQPRFLAFAQGGGGHVTAGGAMCMELLTNTGWSPANNMESVLLQVRLAICSMDPRPARLARQRGSSGQYSIREAITAYMRAAATHGWEVPLELKETAMQ